MKIEKIKKVGDSKYQLILQNKDVITTYDDVMIKYHLLYRKEIDENILESLLKETKISDIYYKSVKKLTTKMMSKKSYKHWLEKFQLSKQNEENLICKLENVGLLNDLYYAKAYASDKARLSKDGIGKIENDLKEEGISYGMIKDALTVIDLEEMNQKLKKMLVKKIEQNHHYSNQHLKQKIISEFLKLGFSYEEIHSALQEVKWMNETEILQKEFMKTLLKAKKKYQGKELLDQVKNKLYQKGFSIEEINECLEKEINNE